MATITGTSGADTLNGTSSTDTISGLAGDDLIYGNADNDLIYGDEDNDTIYGNDGDDEIYGGTGYDHIWGGNGHDRIYTGGAPAPFGDLVYGEAGNDEIYGGDSEQEIHGGTGNDIIYGYADLDYLYGDTGLDQIWGGSGNDVIHGGNDDDIIYGEDGNDTIDGEEGSDVIYGGDGDDILYTWDISGGTLSSTNNDLDKLYGGNGNDILAMIDPVAGHEDAELYGGSGNDTYKPQVGEGTSGGAYDIVSIIYDEEGSSDTLDAFHMAALNDVYYSRSGNNFIITLPNIITAPDSTCTIIDFFKPQNLIENFIFSDVSFSIIEQLTSGNDSYTGTSSTSPFGLDDNIINALAGNDAVYAGIGGDIVWGGDGNDTLYGEAGADYLYGDNNDDMLIGGSGNDTIDGGAGTDTISYASAAAGANINLSTGAVSNDGDGGSDTVSNIENIIGSAYNDTMTGTTGSNIFTGGAGNDSISGGSGNDTALYTTSTSGVTVNLTTGSASDGFGGTDTLSSIENVTGSAYNDTITGGTGANTIIGGAGDDTIDGAGGNDTASYANAASGITANLTTGIVSDGDGGTDTLIRVENITGSTFADILTGDSANNVLSAGGGDDIFYSSAGNDIFHGGANNDTVIYIGAASAINANLWTGSASDGDGGTDVLTVIENITGSNYNDIIVGSNTGNILKGGSGDDIITGGDGADALYGEAGSDIFTLEGETAFNNVDEVFDYTNGTGGDFIDISDVLSDYGYDPLTHVLSDWVQTTISAGNTYLQIDRDGTGSSYTAQNVLKLDGASLSLTDLTIDGNLITA